MFLKKISGEMFTSSLIELELTPLVSKGTCMSHTAEMQGTGKVDVDITGIADDGKSSIHPSTPFRTHGLTKCQFTSHCVR